MKEKKKRGKKGLIVFLCILLILGGLGLVWSRFGGFGTGKSADPAEFASYAGSIEDMEIPEGTKIIALGEATHGNREFQQLKKDVFAQMVEKYKVRSFALEGDFGGCEYVNRYIHTGEGTAAEAAAAIGFAIYRTKEMADLIEWMRTYNEDAPEGEDLRFYGFDMQRTSYTFRYLLEAAGNLGLDTAALEALRDGEDISSSASREEKTGIYRDLREKLEEMGEGKETDAEKEFALHLTDCLLQNEELFRAYEEVPAESNGIRDSFMAENALWILEREKERGNDTVFLAGHNGHMEQYGTYQGGQDKVMGNLLADRIGEENYYVIGTDFYKSTVNMSRSTGGRMTRTFYSADPLAKAASKKGMDLCWLDFGKVPGDSVLRQDIDGYIFMGSLGEAPGDGANGIVYSLLPRAYRIWQSPSMLYDGMIFVREAHPTEIE